MLEETAVVVDVEGDSAWVETQRKSVCGQCSLKNGCGSGILSTVFTKKSPVLKVQNSQQAVIGDQVLLGINENGLIFGSAAVYLLPLLALFLFSLLGQALAEYFAVAETEIFAIVSGFIGFAIAFMWLRRFERRVQDDQRFTPIMLKKL